MCRLLSVSFCVAALTGALHSRVFSDDEAASTATIPEVAEEITPPPLAAYFGFMPVEVYKVDDRSHAMVVGDFDDDGLRDLAVADDAHSRIALLLQRSSPEDEPETISEQVNAISSDWRFRLERLPVDRQILGLVAADFDNDGRDDLAWLGDPDRLTIKRQTADGEWEALDEFRLPDLSTSGQSLAAGDLNGDGKADLVALGTNITYLCLQKADGGLEPPLNMRNTSENVRGAMINDLNGDGRLDLLYGGNRGEEFNLGMRFQSAAGELGPELALPIKDIRVATAGDLSGDSQSELLLIDSLTERLQVLHWQPISEEARSLSVPLTYGFGRPGNTDQGDLVVGDIDGDEWVDVIVSDPVGAELVVYRGGASGLDRGTSYPCLEGVNHLRISDFDADGKQELLVLSPQEHVLGQCRFEDGRLTFPDPLPLGYEAVVMDLADVNGDGTDEVVALGQEAGGREANTLLVGRITTDSWEALINPEESELELTGDPQRITHGDFDRDGRDEIIVTFEGNREPQVFKFDESFAVTEVASSSGTGIGEIEISEIFVDVNEDGASLLTANGGYARRLAWEEGTGWKINEQFNALGGSPRVTRAVSLDIDPAEGKEIVLWDDTAHALRLFRNEEGVSRQYDQIEIGQFPLASMAASDLNRDGKQDLVLVGTSQFAVMLNGVQQGSFEEVASYENTDPEEVLFGDLIVGDVNSDGLPEPILIDHLRHSIEIVASRPAWLLEWGLTFRVFEEKSFAGAGSSGRQPREVLIADVTGDGADDIILLIHDRILVYPQDTGEGEEAVGTTE
jgi:hypothetical protein